MKKIIFIGLLLFSCVEEKERVYVEVSKIENSFFHCKYYIFAVPPQRPLTKEYIFNHCETYKVGDRFYIEVD